MSRVSRTYWGNCTRHCFFISIEYIPPGEEGKRRRHKRKGEMKRERVVGGRREKRE